MGAGGEPLALRDRDRNRLRRLQPRGAADRGGALSAPSGGPWPAGPRRGATPEAASTRPAGIDVVVVSYRCADLLRDCLEALRRHPPARPLHTIVVDNASADGTIEMVEREFPEVEPIANRRNAGFAAASNAGIRAGEAPYVLALNPDTRVSAGALETVASILDSHPEVAVVGCRLEREDGSFDHAARRSFPTPLSALGHFTGVGRRARAPGRLAAYRAPEVEAGPVDAVNGAFMLMRREALDDVGVFDEGYWMYMEDLDLCFRLAEAGWLTWYEPGATVVHVKAGTTGPLRSPRLNWAFHRGMCRFYRSHYAPTRSAAVNAAVYAGIALKLGAAVTRSAVGRGRIRLGELAASRTPSAGPGDGEPPARVRSLSLVVVTWESRAELAGLVDSMLEHLPESVELVVVDNASSDRPELELQRWAGPTRFERLDRNRGFGAACNVGVELAAGEAVALVNPDVELLDARIEAAAGIAAARRALVGPRLLDADGGPQPSASGPVVGIWPWIGAVLPGAAQPAAMLARTEPWRLERTTPVAWLTGACIVGPRALLRELGPFDPEIELMAEDLDLCLRAAERGVPVLFAPEVCRVVHSGGAARRRRFADAGLSLAAANRRAVIARAFGPRRERRGWRAHLLRLRLRSAVKAIVGRSREAELAELSAARGAGRPAP